MKSNKTQKEISKFNFGKLSYELGYTDVALNELKDFIVAYPKSEYTDEAKDLLVNVLANTNNYKEALELVGNMRVRAESVKRVYPKILYGRAVELVNDQQIVQAEILLNEIFESDYNSAQLPFAYFWKGEIAFRTNEFDSAIYYLKKAYAKAQEASFHDGMLKASGLLAALYENNNSDSTLKYLKLNVTFKDSSFSAEKVKQVQSLTFTEQLRQQEMDEVRLKEAEDHRHNLQLMGIAAFIPLFFGVFLLVSKRTMHVSALKFFGLLGLLLLFEFISLLIHPYIMKWTNHAPVYTLILLVAIASLLVPTHHRLEHWLNKKLGNKVH